jgi:cell wall-associated NlpC family hydrolase
MANNPIPPTSDKAWRETPRAMALAVLLVALAGCSTAPRQVEQSNQPAANPQAPLTTQRQDVVMQAMALLDRNYVYNGKKLHTGFDCSGFVSFVYKESAGVVLRGSAADIAGKTRAVPTNTAAPGDLVFFNTLGTPNSHVGIYIGSGKFIHAANERTGVRIDQITSDYWAKRLEGYRSAL